MEAVQSSGVLNQCALPRHRQCKKQRIQPGIIEALADEFIRSGYSIRHMVRLMTTSTAYQLSSRPPDGWKPLFDSYFAKHIARRLTAEEVFDAVNRATGTETPMYVEGFDKPLAVFQGLEDEVVPPNQSEMIVDALRTRGVPVAYLAFEGEQHGFRQAVNIRRALDGELSFYSQVFGFALPADEGIEPLTVENL